MIVEDWPIARLKPYEKNPRKNDEVVERMCAAITEFGFVIPILARSDGEVIDGHLRLKAAVKLKMEAVPVTLADHMTPDQVKAFRLLANKSANWAAWDEDLLRSELLDLRSTGFDISLTGFDSIELSDLFGTQPEERDADETPDAPADPVSRLGDVWRCGSHRVGCLDSTDLAQVRAFLGGVIPDVANCDPPYGVSVVDHRGWVGGRRHSPKNELVKGKLSGVYAPVIGDDGIETAARAYQVIAALRVPRQVMWGANHYAASLPLSRGWLVWDKENTGNYASAELAWTNADITTKLFRHQWNGLIKASEHGQKRVHPTQKPVALAEWVHQTVAPSAKTVLDLFLGSGSVLIAAERAGIVCSGAELSPNYIDCAVLRWMQFSGQEAFHEDGRSWSQVAADRIADEDAVE